MRATQRSGSRPVDVVAVGAAAVDLVIRTPRLPRFDEKVTGALVGWLPGGTMANVACALSRLGGRAVWVGTVGADRGGRLLLEDFRRHRVDARLAVVDRRQATNMTVIFLPSPHEGSPDAGSSRPSRGSAPAQARSGAVAPVSGAERAIVVLSTARDRLPPPDRWRRLLARAQFVYLSPHDAALARRVVATARQQGCAVALEVEPTAARALPAIDPLLSRADLLVCNRGGLALLVGCRLRSRRDAAAEAAHLRARGPALVAVTLGAEGALLATAEGVLVQAGFAVPAVDTTGAGDCFGAALLLALARRWPPARALTFATAAGALATTGVGPRGHLPTRGEVRRLAERGAPPRLIPVGFGPRRRP
ncbi:MAG: PfkB family carbohydrate kinase [Armatimonadota bacterium]|nr:PfkB family carbohydrate kinase [Armatimonadota bacterium]MDR7448041.1 PfkB family carbohydrate kinase [Armatimonadota bacterium]MDR7459590.1 PfkB family carbohydrate kinase [Armatimonadota bacterium]MDR7478635.1 PfkB family carbohydrate kinase [Armatimonadota bacterium]MDR7488030.1 PfkB family carbohydrate kinase [Armatimonadota bacterium]